MAPKGLSPLKQKLVDAGYDPEEVAVMSKKQMGIITYWAGGKGGPIEVPSPSEIDDEWRLENSKSDLDKLCTYWKTTKGGTDEEIDLSQPQVAAESKGALPSMLESPFVKKTKKH